MEPQPYKMRFTDNNMLPVRWVAGSDIHNPQVHVDQLASILYKCRINNIMGSISHVTIIDDDGYYSVIGDSFWVENEKMLNEKTKKAWLVNNRGRILSNSLGI